MPSAEDTLVGEECVGGSDLQRRGTLIDSTHWSDNSRPRLTEGARIGRYVLLRRVGSGGMGAVYAAYDPQLDRRVALKVLKRDGFDAAGSKRAQAQLVREAQAMARLSHANVVTVHDVGTIDSHNKVFVAMEFIEGSDLKRWLRAESRSWREIVEVLVQAGRGLAAAHDAGLVHRDFKPDNVLVGDDGRVVVTDFGIARRLESVDIGAFDPDAGAETMAAAILNPGESGTLGQAGTPAYMPPEQHLGRPASAAGDQFSFAITLYEALYSEHPFEGTDPVSFATSVMDDKRRPPREDHRVPQRIRRALDRALKRDPRGRWPHMKPLLAQLSASRIPPRPVWAAIAVGAVALTVAPLVQSKDEGPCVGARERLDGIWDDGERQILGEAFTRTSPSSASSSWDSVARELDDYADRWVATHTEACRATARGEQSQALLDLRMQCLDRRREALSQVVKVLEDVDATVVGQARGAVEGLPSIDPCSDPDALRRSHPPPSSEQRQSVKDVDARISRARALFNAGLVTGARDEITLALRQAEESNYAPVHARALFEAGMIASALGDPAGAEAHLVAGLRAARSAGDAKLELETWLQLLYVVGYLDERPGDAERWYPLVEGLLEQLERPPALRASFESTRGAIAHAAGRSAEATRRFQRALSLRERAEGQSSPRVAADHARLAAALVQQGQYEEAGLECDRAMRLHRDLYGVSHPQLVATTRSCAAMELSRGNLARAEELHGRALDAAIATYGEGHPSVAEILGNLGALLRERGDFPQSETHLRRALELLDQRTTPRPRLTGELQAELAHTLLDAGAIEEATQLSAQAVASIETAGATAHPAYGLALLVRGRIESAAGHLPTATAVLRQSVEALDPEHPSGVLARTVLADVELQRGRADPAQREIEIAVSMLDRVQAPAGIRAEARFTQARIAHHHNGTGRQAALEAVGLWAAMGDREAERVAEVNAWLERAKPR